jgi:predicted amidophosphoribosyltransferase
MERSESPCCPVCQARFRDSSTCSRCGADLAPLMLLIAKAHRLRQEARGALQAGDHERALRLAAEAQATCSSSKGRELWLLSAWLLALSREAKAFG